MRDNVHSISGSSHPILYPMAAHPMVTSDAASCAYFPTSITAVWPYLWIVPLVFLWGLDNVCTHAEWEEVSMRCDQSSLSPKCVECARTYLLLYIQH